jgi:predicted AlkP superfamily pyrophosphatase or phosphodiesterase
MSVVVSSRLYVLITVLLVGLLGHVDLRAAGPPAKAENIVLFMVDGLRPDALKHAKTPNMESLIKRGASTMKAQTVTPSVTLPAFASMMTGLTVEQHGVDWNDYEPQRGYLKSATIFELASFYGRHWGALFLNKQKLLHIAKPDLRMDLTICSVDEPGCNAKKIASDVIAYYKNIARDPKPSLFIVHMADADVAGHARGWMSKPYLQAVEACDRAIGTIIKGFQDLGIYERTTFIVTADHGGHDTTHGTASPEDVTIPWIVAGPGVKAGYEVTRPVSLIDTPATIMQAFGINDYYAEWSSRSVEEIFEGTLAQVAPPRGGKLNR